MSARLSKMRSRHGLARGFTLMEVMLATVILGIITTLVWQSFSRSLQVRERIVAMNERHHQARLTMERLSRELSMAYLSAHRSSMTDPRTMTLFVGEDSRPSELTFTAFAHQRLYEDINESDQAVISYYVAPDPEDPRREHLWRRELPRIADEDTNRDLREGQSFILCEDVIEFDIEYWERKDDDWLREWDSTGIERANRLPPQVRIHLTIKDERGKEISFYTKARIELEQPLAF